MRQANQARGRACPVWRIIQRLRDVQMALTPCLPPFAGCGIKQGVRPQCICFTCVGLPRLGEVQAAPGPGFVDVSATLAVGAGAKTQGGWSWRMETAHQR